MKKVSTKLKKVKKSSINNNIAPKLCLICGISGDHETYIISPNILGSASGTPLSQILRKVVGEELFYPLSKYICHHCFILLDRLDAYEARAAEIRTHIKDRYKDTKLQFISKERQITKLIESSLTDIKKYENGTTLNVSNELSVTVFHEGVPAPLGEECKYSENEVIQPETLNNAIKHSVGSRIKRTSNITASHPSKKLKTSRRSNDIKCSDNNNNNNNSNFDDNVSLEENMNSNYFGECSSSANGNDFSKSKSDKYLEFTTNNSLHNDSDFSDSESYKSDDVNNRNMSSENKKINSDEELSDFGENDILELNKCSLESSGMEEHSPHIGLFNESENCSNSQFEEINPSKTNQDIAQAVLLQNSLASNLLQSFLSSSLWMNSSSSDEQGSSKAFAVNTEDGPVVTADSLCEAIGFAKDKKTRLELKNAGRSYVNTKGVVVDAKRIWPQDCSRCPLKCNQRLTEEMRVSVFTTFWGLGDYDLQRKYLSSHMERVERIGTNGFPRIVVNYYLKHEDNKIQVCRQFFLKTLDVSEKASRIVLKKKLRGEL